MTERTRTGNRLADSKSPYLLQHADNPVDWHEWGEEAFRTAREEEKPLFVSIGYSTCHWCHVMAHESFEDPEVAEVLNRHFVSVKVDREERPDVDTVYMRACQMMTGGGGWPLTVIATPEGEPFFAGTYFPKEGRGGRPGLVEILLRIADMWEERRDHVRSTARKATSALKGMERGSPGAALGAEELEEAYRSLRSRYDDLQGGFGSAPKFPSPHNLLFLLRHWDRTGEEEALEMAANTLRHMRRGGIHDHVGGGFHRYSTDARWLLPHFEKMLYDQALLALAYTEAFQATGDEDHARTVRRVFDYVLRDLRDEAGGFHSAEDADSEGGEGKFYLWTEEELRGLLPDEDFRLVKQIYNTRERGNFAEEATGRRTGENILHRTKSIAELAGEREVSPEELRERLEGIHDRLFEAREERPRPHRDDKVLADWNGLMIGALARGGAVLGEARALAAAREAADFLLGALRDGEGRLLHRWRDGEAAVPATAADYAFLIFGLVELYEADFDPRWLREALRLQEEFVARCWDEEEGGFFLTGEGSEELLVRPKEADDGALPSSNSVAAWNLARLARLTGRTELEERAEETERAFAERLRRAPAAHAGFLLSVDFRVGRGHEVVLVAPAGPGPERERMLGVLRRDYRPRTVVLLRPAGEEEPEIVALAPYARPYGPVGGGEGEVAAYVCTDFSCREPVTDPGALRRLLGEEEEEPGDRVEAAGEGEEA